MKKWIVGLGAVIGLLLIFALTVPFVVPKDTVKEQIVAQLQAATGWRLRIDGDINISALPFLKLNAKDVGVSGEAGADGLEFVTVREIRFGLSLLSLLSGVVEVTGVTLVEPNLFLETDAAGRTSWEPRRDVATAATPAEPVPAEAEAEAETEQAESPGATLALLDRLRFGALEIRDGIAVWDDRRANQKHTISKINVTARMPSLRDAARVDGSVTWNDIAVAFDLKAGDPLALTEGRQSEITGSVSAAGGTVTVDGKLTPAPAPAFDGRITAAADSLRDMIAALGAPAPDMEGLGEFELETGLTYGNDTAKLTDFTATLDETTLTGTLTAALAGARPNIQGNFAVNRIDLDRFRPKGGNDEKATKTTAKTGSDAPIDLAPLKTADAAIAITIGALTGGGVKVEGVDGRITLVDGKLDLDIAETRLLGGTAALALVADGQAEVPAFSGRLKSSGLSVPDILKLAGRNDKVTGTIETNLAFSAKGKTVPALTGGLALSGTAGLRDASVAGLDLADAFGGDKRANRLDNLSVEAKIAGLGEPIDVNGGLDWRGDRFDIKARATPSALAAGAPSPVMVRVGSKRVTVGFDGNASTSGKADGKVLVETPSVRGLAEWLGNPLPPGKGLEKFRFSGKLAFAKDVLSFTNADVVLDGTEGSGSGRIALGGKRPNIKAKLALSVLTLDPYLGGGAAGGGGGGKAAKSWSKEPIDFSGLRAADADLELSTKGIRWDQIKIGKTEIAVKLAGGKLDARLTKMGLYRGTGTGHLVLDGSGKNAAVNAAFKLNDTEAFPLLRDAADFEYIEGTADLDIALKTNGRSQHDLVSALNGDASFNFQDGAIRGINIAKMMRSLSADVLLGWQKSQSEKTDFSVFQTKFKITDGVAKSTAFRLVGPLVRVGGGGTIHMPKQTIDWKADPKVVASLEGQGAGGKKNNKNKNKNGDKKEKLAGLGVPVIIKGPWSNPQIYPDIEGILSNPQAAYDKLKSLGGGLFENGTIDALTSGKGLEDITSGLTTGSTGGAVNQATKALGLGTLGGIAAGQAGGSSKAGKANAKGQGKNAKAKAAGKKNAQNNKKKKANQANSGSRDINSAFDVLSQ